MGTRRAAALCRAAQPLTYPADQTNSSRTEMAREKKNVEQYFARMQRKLAAEADGPAPLEVEPTPAAEEPKAKKQARPSKRTSEVQKKAPAEPPEPVLFAEVVCSEVMTMAQKV